MRARLRLARALAALTVLFSRAAAAQTDAEGAQPPIEIHGFVSQGFILTAGNEYLARGSTRGSADYSQAGINFTGELTDTLRIGVQLFAQDLGWNGDYTADFDWFYADYRWQDWLALRVGRLKIPYGLYNEIQDIDAARVPVLLPGSVYPLQTRQVLFSQTGAEVYGFLRFPAAGALEYRVFGGTIFLDADELTPAGAPFDIEFDVPHVLGGRLLWETPLDGLRMAASIESIRFDTTVIIPGMGSILIENESLLWVGSLEYTMTNLTLTAEYSRWHSEQESDNPMLSPPIEGTSERAYVMATYGVATWFQPGAYYSLFYPDIANREGPQNVQHDAALTLRFDINAHWLVKLEGHYMHGTAGLLDPLRINPPDISQAEERWGAFFLKATAHF